MENKMDEITEKINAQNKYQEDNNFPDFPPKDGRCFRCGKQIFEAISLEKASSELITGCPYCFWSFVD